MNHELSYQEDKIKQILSEMNSTFSDIQSKMEFNADYQEYHELEETFVNLFKDIFNLCLVYFEAKGLLLYRSRFESEFSPFFEKIGTLLDREYDGEGGDFIAPLLQGYGGICCHFLLLKVLILFFTGELD